MFDSEKDLLSIKKKFYLNTEDLREMLKKNQDIFEKEEDMYLNRLVLLEQNIIAAIQDWIDIWKKHSFQPGEFMACAEIISELMQPLSPFAISDIQASFQAGFPKEILIQSSGKYSGLFYSSVEEKSVKQYIPWGFMGIGALIIAGSQYLEMQSYFLIGAVLLTIGAVWLYLKQK